jgi:hypothetical protein
MKKPQIGAEQAKFLKTMTAEALAERPHLKTLCKRLLGIGGTHVILWNGANDPDFTQPLMATGKLYDGRQAILRLGKRSECHENSAKLHKENPQRYTVLTAML